MCRGKKESMGNCTVITQYVYKQNIDKIKKILILDTPSGTRNLVVRFSGNFQFCTCLLEHNFVYSIMFQ